MPFSAGSDLCCAAYACVLLDTNTGSGKTWDKIPHVTQISFNEQANNPGLVTSDSAGLEIPVCGLVQTTGNLSIACHSGTGPGLLCINTNYRLRWSVDCDNIWDNGSAVADNLAGEHFEALVKITSVPLDYNIKGNTAVETNYGFRVIEWTTKPSCQTDSE